jgi:hypothetical protein
MAFSQDSAKFWRQRELIQVGICADRGEARKLLEMTIDPFKNHFNKTKLLKISNNLMKDKVENDENEFKTLVHVEGKVLKVTIRNKIFQDIVIQDTESSIIMPIISFEPVSISVNTALMCIGTIHYNWTPDMRCEQVKYPVALKAIVIKQR